jgi:tellurite resistance protein TehA-like permease
VAGLHPAYFALVMATGIVGLACHVTGIPLVPGALLALNVVSYATLWALTILRAARHRDQLVADVRHHGRSVGFFTAVAATCVLGSQCLFVGAAVTPALVLWLVGLGLWAALTYTIFTVIVVKRDKPSLAEGIHGGWLLAVVAPQSVAVLGAQLAPHLGPRAPLVVLVCVATWLGGAMLYIWIISLIFQRYAFFTMSPSDLAPPYWINMGAAAITTLAGASIALAAPHAPLVEQILPFVRGFTLFWWATATWWIPMLIILGVWRHVARRFPLAYDPLYWGVVFPLGMYTVCTHRLASAVATPELAVVPRVFVWVALAAWCVVAAGLVATLARGAAARIAPRRP